MASYEERVQQAKSGPNLGDDIKAPAPSILGDLNDTAGLSEETVAGLQAMGNHVAESAPTEAADVDAPAEPVAGGEPSDDAVDFDIRDLLAGTDPLRSRERREAIESRLDDMDLGDIFTKREIRQRVPIIPGKFTAVFRTVEAREDLLIKRILFSEEGSDQYFADRYSTMLVCAGTVTVNDENMPMHTNEKGDLDEGLFKKKLRIFERLPVQLLMDLVNNYQWFDSRVKDLFTEDNLKNG